MDPDQALLDWARAVLAEDREAANDAHENLSRWMRGGGFEPSWGEGMPSRKQFDSYDRATGMIS